MQDVSIVIVGRDRFSPTAGCIESVLAHTPPVKQIIVVLGGASKKIQDDLPGRYAGKAKFIFKPEFINGAQSRNIGLREAGTGLAAVMDNDVTVRPGWLEPLVRCQKETGAALVVPVVLERGDQIHAAGCDLYVTYKNGEAYGIKEMRYKHMVVCDGTNLKREAIDFGETHCQLVEVETALRLNVYDEFFREQGDVIAGLTWAKAGHPMYFEPASIVHYGYPMRLDNVEDLKFFMWKWDMKQAEREYEYIREKWNIDMTELGSMREFLLGVNSTAGFFSRAFPSQASLRFDGLLRGVKRAVLAPGRLYRALKRAMIHRD